MSKLQNGNTVNILYGHLILEGDIKCITGLHIGGATETIEIGGIDKYIIRNPMTNEPYIPGSSLKGKLRSIVEKITEVNGKPLKANRGCDKDGKIWRHECDNFTNAQNCPLCRLFGATGSESENDNYSSKLIVSDCALANPDKLLKDGLYITEAKMENTLDRLTGAASPRTFERIPAGAMFKFRVVYKLENFYLSEEQNKNDVLFELKSINDDIKNILSAMDILEKEGLGGSVSRGYGRIKFMFSPLEFKPVRENNEYKLKETVKKEKSVLDLLNQDVFEK